MNIDISTIVLLLGQIVAATTVIWRVGGRQARYEEKVDNAVVDIKDIRTAMVSQSECTARMRGVG